MKGLIFTYLMTYGGAASSLFNPWYGLLIYICFATIKPESLWFWSVPVGNYSRIVAIALLIGWAINGFGNWNFARARPIVIAGMTYWLWSFVSAVTASDQNVAFPYIESLSKIMLPFLVGATLIDSPAKVRQLLWVIAVSVGYIAIELNRLYLKGYNLEADGFLGLDNNGIAILLTPGLGLGFFLARSETNWLLKSIGVLISLAVAHVCMFSFSRGAMLAMVVTGGVSFLLIPKQPKHYFALLVVVLICLKLMGKEVMAEFFSSFNDANERDYSAESRLDLWGDCWDTMLKYPLTGVGPDHWQFRVVEYGYAKGKEAHSTWFQVGAELGFPGIGALLAMYGLTLTGLWSLCRSPSPSAPWAAEAARSLIAALIGVLVAISFVTCEGIEPPYYLAMAAVGVLRIESVASPPPDASAV